MNAIQKNADKYRRTLERLRGDRDLSDEARRRLMGEAYSEATRKHRDLAEAEEAETAKNITRLEKSVFGISYPADATTGVDKERVRQSFRDASFRVSGMEPEELQKVLERVERTQDKQLAKAVYHEATERGVRHVADAYLKDRTEERSRWEEYTSARVEAESVESLLFGPNAYHPSKPPELDGMAGPASSEASPGREAG